MKKIIGFMLLTFIAFTTLNAQSNFIGLRAGMELSRFNMKNKPNDYNIKNKNGFTVGIFYRYHFTKCFSVQPEIDLVRGGSKLTPKESGNNTEYKMTYLNIPVLAGYNISVSKSFSPRIFVGPQLGFILSAKQEGEKKTDIKKKTKSPNFGLVFGAGGDFSIGENLFSLDFRYNLGLKNINKDFTGEKVKQNSFSFTVSYALGI